MNESFKIFNLPLIIISCVLIITTITSIMLSVIKKNIKIIFLCLIYEIIIFGVSFIFLKNRKETLISEQDLVFPTINGPLVLTQLTKYSGECDPSNPEMEIFVQYAASLTNTVTQNESDKIYSDIVKILSTKGKSNIHSSFVLDLPDQDSNTTVTLWVAYLSTQVFDSKINFTSLVTLPTNKNITYIHDITKPESRNTITGIPPICKNTYILHDTSGKVYPIS